MKKILSLALFLTVAMITGCSSDNNTAETQASAMQSVTQQTETEYYMYNFKPCNRDLLPYGRSKIRGLYDDSSAEYHSLFIGQALTLFGEADYTTENNEDLYSKAISAENKDGNVVYLEVYYGPSGPAIGGDIYDEENKKAADALAEYIMSTEPKDFEYKSVYEDLGVTIRMGVENGKPYYISDIPEDLF